MQYRDFGRTGVKVSALGFGAMRLPMQDPKTVRRDEALPLLVRAYELGVTYFDTGKFYCGEDSERTLGEALKLMDRSRVQVSTKYPAETHTKEDVRAKLTTSLEILDLDYVDFYHLWGISWKSFETELGRKGGVVEEVWRMKEEGLVRHVSFSFHSEPEDIPRLVDTGLFETMLCQYNLLDRRNEAGMRYAKSRGLGVAVMGPVGGGRLGAPSAVLEQWPIDGGPVSSPALALRFVLANPDVDMALSGMSNQEQLIENVATASLDSTLSTEEKERVARASEENARLAELYCTGCKYCLPCPEEVNIPEIFHTMNSHRVWGLTKWAREHYQEIGTNQWVPGRRADACVRCGSCEDKCPQKLPIMERLAECHALFGAG